MSQGQETIAVASALVEISRVHRRMKALGTMPSIWSEPFRLALNLRAISSLFIQLDSERRNWLSSRKWVGLFLCLLRSKRPDLWCRARSQM